MKCPGFWRLPCRYMVCGPGRGHHTMAWGAMAPGSKTGPMYPRCRSAASSNEGVPRASKSHPFRVRPYTMVTTPFYDLKDIPLLRTLGSPGYSTL